MSVRFEFGQNFLEITNFRYFSEDAVGGCQYNTLFDLRVQSCDGKFAGVGDCEDDIKHIRQLADELQKMYELKLASVKYRDAFGNGAEIEFTFSKTGHITVSGKVMNFVHSMEFEFEADQTALPTFINGINIMLKEQGYE